MHFSTSTFLAPNLQQFSAVAKIMHFFGAIWDKFAFNFVLISIEISIIDAETPLFNGAIWAEFTEQD